MVGLVTALLTAFYMSRQVFLVFFGERALGRTERGEHAEQAEPTTSTLTIALDHAPAPGGPRGPGRRWPGCINLPFSEETSSSSTGWSRWSRAARSS